MDSGQNDPDALVAALETALERHLLFWGSELHNGVCQSLAGTVMLLETIRRAVESGKPVPLDRLCQLQNSIENAIEQTRQLAREFNPLQLQGAGLMKALSELAGPISGRVECKFVCEKPVFVTNESVALGLYRVAQELCRLPMDAPPENKFTISLYEDKSWVILEVVRNGEWAQEHVILIEARMRALGGDCTFHSSERTRTTKLRVKRSHL